MIRIKLFALFIAFALLALVRPRKCLEMLEAADAGAKSQADKDLIERQNALVQRAPSDERAAFDAWWSDFEDAHPGWRYADAYAMRWNVWQGRAQLAQECPRPPAGWRCTRRAGHDGPCAAVVK